MTADERIESLLNCFGQTISDLPAVELPHQGVTRQVYGEPDLYGFLPKIYGDKHIFPALTAACKYHQVDERQMEYLDIVNRLIVYVDYICHLTDVIDRMEIALNTAKLIASCAYCRHEDGNECEGCIGENFEIDDSVFIEEDDEFTEEGD